jgi:hypothetical protein
VKKLLTCSFSLITFSSEEKDPDSEPYSLVIQKIRIHDSQFIYEDNNNDKTNQGIDFAHLNITNLQLEATHFVMDSGYYKVNIQHLAADEQSGFSLKKFQGEALVSDMGHKSKTWSLLPQIVKFTCN